MPAKVNPQKKRVFAARLRDGWTIKEAAEFANVSYAWAKAYARALRDSSGASWASSNEEEVYEGPIPLEQLGEEASRALEDIAFFAERYFGARVMPFQREATARIVELQSTSEEEYVVINVAPGSGKSTFFTKILPAWITCRQRHIRGLIGSASMQMAKLYVGELRDILDSPVPLHQPPEAVKRGISVEPSGCLLKDYGKFKTQDRKWASDAFFVQQPGGAFFAAKEPTWQAFGRGSIFIGSRVDFAIWDDVYDPEQNRTEDTKQQLFKWWVDVAEKRLEPGGLMVLQGQRLDPQDIYRFALDRKQIEVVGNEEVETRPKYHHIKFKAHYDEKCEGDHGKDAKPYPEGCLLYPGRLSWRKLLGEKENDPEGYELIYQQEDTAPGMVLVDKLWVKGGRGPDGGDYPGCWDEERGLCELPEGLTRPILSVVAADPSPTRYWAIEWWVYHFETQQRFLMDIERRVMDAPSFLDWRLESQTYTGLMEEWQKRSVDLGAPISYWIVEANAAQKFMLQYDYAKKWLAKNSVTLIPHETYRNKSDPKMGVTSLGPHWKYGRVRLPGAPGPGRLAAAKLVSEATRYRLDGKPSGTDDCVMAEWFFEWNLPQLADQLKRQPKAKRPRFMRRAA